MVLKSREVATSRLFFWNRYNRKGWRSLHPFRPKSYHKLNLLMLWHY